MEWSNLKKEKSARLNVTSVQLQQRRDGKRPMKTELHFSPSFIIREHLAIRLPKGLMISCHTARVQKAFNADISSITEVWFLKIFFFS